MKKDNKSNIKSKNNKIDLENKVDKNKDNRFLKLFKKYSIIIYVFLVIFVFVVVLGTSYAFFTSTVKGKEFVIYTGNLAVNYKKKTDVINVENLYPMTNTEGLNQTPHEFTITNDGNINARYQVRLELDNSIKDMISINYIKLSYSIDGSSYSEPVLLSDLDTSLAFIRNIQLAPTKSNTIGIKLWIDINAPNEVQGKVFKAKVVVDSIQDVEDGYVVDTTPIIYLNKDENGNQDINLKVGENYTELGVEKIEDDQDIFTPSQVTKTYEYYDGENLSTAESVDTSKTGIYYITYSITDKSNNVGKTTRIVTVNNTDTIPSITLNGETTITLEETEEYTEQGVTVSDNNTVVTIGEVKTNVVGTYIVRYIVIDSSNNLNSVIRTVIVNRKQVVITFDYNYLENNSFEDLYNTSLVNYNVTRNLIYQKDVNEYGITHIATMPANELNTHYSAGYYFSGIDIPLTGGTKYTMTFEARGSENFGTNIGSEQDGYKYFDITTEWKRYNHTFVAASRDVSDIHHVAFIFYSWGSAVSDRTLEVRNIFFQEGENNSLKSYTLLWGDPLYDTYEIPTREGYQFVGWFTDPVYGIQIDDTSLVPKVDTTYYAHWRYNLDD